MKKFNCFLVLLLCFISLFTIIACNNKSNNNIDTNEDFISDKEDSSSDDNNLSNVIKTDEEIVIEMFMQNATLDKYGNYSFIENFEAGNILTTYNFTYNPLTNNFVSTIFTCSYASFYLYDYASIIFTWGDFRNGIFYASHELDKIAKVEFEYFNITFNNYQSLGDSYQYNLIGNTFVNLKEKQDIDEYAMESFYCLQQAISYPKSILAKYKTSVKLW